MIEILCALAFIQAGRLQMDMVKRANPNLLLRRRNHQRTDPLERVAIANDPAFSRAVTKPLMAMRQRLGFALNGHLIPRQSRSGVANQVQLTFPGENYRFHDRRVAVYGGMVLE